MEQLKPEDLNLLIGSAIFAAVFFIAVTLAIIYFFRRAERGDRAETARFSEENDAALPPDEESPGR